ncbi:TPA: dCTP deaminase [Candidatus Saccharibacteria bacterium]|nr:dCTP deaminase [Candidatus Saccharibacteria bacterium]HIO87353.1 dCTP deaminase [Candidatus Saccharibacteria bacterium]
MNSTDSVFSNTQIVSAYQQGHIVINPYNPDNVSEASYDVTLGEYFYTVEKLETRTVYNPFDADEVRRYFDGPHKAITHQRWIEKHNLKPFNNIPLDHPIIVLKPQERILAHTHEFIGIKPPGASEMRSRSSWGRNGLAVCFDAGWIDPGYINRVTMEIYNLNQHESIVLPVGERIAQIVFHHTGPVEGNYGLGRGGISGKYQSGTELEDIVQRWHPEQMLPKSWLDKRQLPQEVVVSPKKSTTQPWNKAD